MRASAQRSAPFLEHYQTSNGDQPCDPSGTTGDWWAASGASNGYEQWTVDLSAYTGSEVEVSISYASDDTVQGTGAFVDDVTVSTGEGTTSFEDDGDALDGWTVSGGPRWQRAQPQRLDCGHDGGRPTIAGRDRRRLVRTPG